MKQSKLTITLQTFSTAELNTLGRFLASPYFNHRKDVLQFFELLKTTLKSSKPLPDKTYFFKKIYAEPYDDQKFRLLKSYLTQLVEKFLIVEAITQHPAKNQLQLAKAYRQRGLTHQFEKVIKKTSDYLEKQALENADAFEYHFQLLWEQHQSIVADKPVEKQLLQLTSDKMDRAFISLKMKHFCLLATHQNVYGSTFEKEFLDKILATIVESDWLEEPTIGTYYYGYQVLTQPEESDYFAQFKRILLEKGGLLHPQETRLLFLLGINHAIQQSNHGKKQYLNDLKDLYEEGLKKKYLFEKGKLSRFSYLNIISTGITTKDYDWVEHIIYTYQHALEEKYRESSFSFNLARLEYCRKNYDKALLLLQQNPPQNILLNLASKNLLIKIYYELDEFEALESHLGAVRNFIRRKKKMGYHREKYVNFILYVQKLIRLNPFDKQAKGQLEKRVQQEAELMEKAWLLEQLGEL
ncbi:MAG: hypothetical protein AAF960_30130 [Bacteroidota bacterium]